MNKEDAARLEGERHGHPTCDDLCSKAFLIRLIDEAIWARETDAHNRKVWEDNFFHSVAEIQKFRTQAEGLTRLVDKLKNSLSEVTATLALAAEIVHDLECGNDGALEECDECEEVVEMVEHARACLAATLPPTDFPAVDAAMDEELAESRKSRGHVRLDIDEVGSLCEHGHDSDCPKCFYADYLPKIHDTVEVSYVPTSPSGPIRWQRERVDQLIVDGDPTGFATDRGNVLFLKEEGLCWRRVRSGDES